MNQIDITERMAALLSKYLNVDDSNDVLSDEYWDTLDAATRDILDEFQKEKDIRQARFTK